MGENSPYQVTLYTGRGVHLAMNYPLTASKIFLRLRRLPMLHRPQKNFWRFAKDNGKPKIAITPLEGKEIHLALC
jgi:hypothetical protein